MGSYILRRVLYAIPIALGVTIICFSLIYIGPTDPIQAVVPDDATAEDIERIRIAYGFDKPIPVQYLMWLGRAVTGEFGNSLQSNRPVIEDLLPAIGNTFRIAIVAMFLSATVAFVLGSIAAFNHGRWLDRIVTAFAVAGVSIPHFWLAIVMVIVFSVELGALPAMGMGPDGSSSWQLDWTHVKHMILPVIALSVIPMATIMRTTRGAVLEILGQEFVQTLRAKGLAGRRILLHIVKNAAPTVLAVTGLQIGQLLGGSILIETVFSWPGTGRLLNEAIFKRDLPTLQATILLLAMFFVTLNLVVDVVQTWVDPRIKRG
ncbi:MAG: ABC transporter permease [Alphaproteobacteria bacterium]|nr:ABC transporter permease [Alphaproteobacteria bacterium]